MTNLGTLPGAGISFATGINDAGQVTGYAYTGADGASVAHSFLDVGGRMTDLGTFGHAESYAQAINASGQIAGDVLDGSISHGFFYSNGHETDIGTFGGPSSFAWGINNAGQVVGGASLPGGQATHAFLYSNGMMKDLGTLGGVSSWATSINDEGQVVGWSGTADGGFPHLFLYTDGKMVDLNNLIPPGSGWVLGAGYGDPKINDDGQIIVSGSLDGRADSFALLTPSNLPTPPSPVPEPSTLSFLGLVAGAGVVRLIKDRVRRDRAKVR
jgi:probable HAF family extracellular repeat protein